MFRSKDFMTMNVMDVKGKKIGYISDLSLDLQKNVIDGFIISPYSIISKKNITVRMDDIVYFDRSMIISSLSHEEKLRFCSIKGMDVVNIDGDIIGMIEDLVLDDRLFIKGYIISSGWINKIIKGKRVILSNKIILGDKTVLNFDTKEYSFLSIRHGLKGVECNE